MLLLKLQEQGRRGRSTGKGRKWGSGRGGGGDLSGEQLGREMGAGVQGAGAARGSMLTRGPPFCQTGGRHAGPANPPNHRGSGHQPSGGGALLTPHGEGLASQKGTPAKQGMVHGRISDLEGSGVLDKIDKS